MCPYGLAGHGNANSVLIRIISTYVEREAILHALLLTALAIVLCMYYHAICKTYEIIPCFFLH